MKGPHPASLLSAGYLAALTYWAFTGISVHANPWFSFLSHALSDLGGPGAREAWIYNTGLLAAGLLMMVYALAVVLAARDKLGVLGGAYLSVAALFLALIGLYPAGTRPHVFISTYFFIQAFMAILVLGVGLLRSHRADGLALLLLFTMGVVGAFVPWPSVALQETYEIALLIAFLPLYNRSVKGVPRRGPDLRHAHPP